MFKRKAMAFIAICLSVCLTVLPTNASRQEQLLWAETSR